MNPRGRTARMERLWKLGDAIATFQPFLSLARRLARLGVLRLSSPETLEVPDAGGAG